jgi:hypothetical protein
MHRLHASCHCQNIVLELELTRPPETYAPRACDCDFCTKHGATYLSDPGGTLAIRVTDRAVAPALRAGEWHRPLPGVRRLRRAGGRRV